MRKFFIFLLIFVHKIALCQLNDNFNDSDFTTRPIWATSNNNQDFIINEDKQLQSNSTNASSNFYISTENTKALNCVWEFDCNLKFATSGSNYADIYLISNTSNLQSNAINGYFVRIGGTDDEISLFKRNGAMASSTKIIDGANGTVNSSSNNPFRIKVTRTPNGEFILECDKTQTGKNYQLEGSATDNTFTTSNWFGVLVQQSTASFHQKHFFDNFIIKNISAPELVQLITEENIISLNFDQPLNTNKTKDINNYTLQPGNIKPAGVNANLNNISLEFENLASGNYSLSIYALEGLYGNAISLPISQNFRYIKPYQAKPNDIVINEIFADPSPQVDLPSTEFIELRNTTSETISLKGYKYGDLTTSYIFSDEVINPNEFLILCSKTDTTEYKKYGRVLGIAPWPSLNNASDQLILMDAQETIIHSVNYSDTWYKDSSKKNGGYTLELIDPKSACISSQNYSASNDASGGTPGRPNSIDRSNYINEPLKLLAAEIKDSYTLFLRFNRGIDSLQASLNTHYTVNQNGGNPAHVILMKPHFTEAELIYTQPFSKDQTYTLNINGVSDCGNQTINNQSIQLVYPGDIKPKDILINEILFNPRPDGADFVEVYNNSTKTLDFKDLLLATANDKDSVTTVKNVSNTSILFEPGTYWVLSTDPDNIKSEYFTSAPDNFIKMNSMPAYGDSKSVVILLNKELERIDQLNYDAKMHFPLLKDVEGISLERSFFNEETNKAGNFRSATASVGYATPAYKNSQHTESIEINAGGISLSPKVLSPNNDGNDDLLSIHYQLDQNNYVGNVSIYNDQGRLIKKLISNEQVSASGFWIWDGIDQSQNRVKTGIYIVYTELFDLSGNSKRYKTAFSVVAGK